MENEEEQGEEVTEDRTLGHFIAGAILGAVGVGFVCFMAWPAPRNISFQGTIFPNGCPDGYNCHTELTKKTPEESIEDLRYNVDQLNTQVKDLQNLPTAKKEAAKVAADKDKARAAAWKEECSRPGVVCVGPGVAVTGNNWLTESK